MAENGVGDDALLPATALAVALVALDEVQRNDLSQEEEDTAPDLTRPRLSRTQRQRKYVERCAWARMLEDKDLEESNSRTSKQFRLDFRVPCAFFLRLVALVKSKNWFATAGCDAAGRQSHPVEHKVLAWLTILGRGNCFASIYQMSWMSAATVQAMFHMFCKHFAREMYDEHIYLPSEQNGELDHVMKQYDRLGFSGAMGSMDVTHIVWNKCPYNLPRSYTGKEGVPTIGYQVTVNHAGRASAVTEGFTGSTNDKTIVCWDAAVEKIRTDKQYTEKTFDVYNEDGTTTTLKGCYLLVDNGYHKWQILMGAHQVPAERERSPLFEEAGERAEGRGMLLRHPERPLQDPEARHGVPRAGAHRQRVLHVLHLAQHAAHLRRNGRAGGKHAMGQQCRGGDHVGDRAGGGL
ncbi:transposon protein, putative, Pong sub-class [Ectocarpus siliculosus]|uniref:Transposon protein, putative, Pong sub-class n=1 Tax=Ectocarpus siliculosus TaxID=2880 RepID=D7FPI7_ECTSI|nr:transposon protein, putative, Pong sub-class [Ectocarpus siliculosus]|eukprot:CBJ30444.1 transposon protein, putative, Pong sub-class [Ectocarpus siliculosus]